MCSPGTPSWPLTSLVNVGNVFQDMNTQEMWDGDAKGQDPHGTELRQELLPFAI